METQKKSERHVEHDWTGIGGFNWWCKGCGALLQTSEGIKIFHPKLSESSIACVEAKKDLGK